MKRILTIAALPLALAACGLEGKGPTTGFQAALPPAPKPAVLQPTNGAIFQASHGYAALHEGNRARSVGDVVTVMLVENVNSSKSASGATNRQGSAGITPPTSGPLGFLNPGALNASAQGSFNGQGNAAQRSQLSGSIAVTIAEIRGNGTALIIGEKQMKLSQGDEWVQFAGILRLADVDADNRVLSTQIADAKMIYTGKGAIQQSSRPGWLSRFFSAISPF